MYSTASERILGISNNENINGNNFLLDLPDAFGRVSTRSLIRQDISNLTYENVQSDSWDLRDNAYRSGVSSTNRVVSDDISHLREFGELELVEFALASGLPNEVDIALNSLLALSVNSPSDTFSSIRLSYCRNLLNLLLAVVGIFDDSSNTFSICDLIWKQQTHLNFLEGSMSRILKQVRWKFWHSAIHEEEGRVFLRPDVFINSEPEESNGAASTLTELFAPPVPTAVFHKAQPCEQLETTRVLLVGTILVNMVTAPSQPVASNANELDDDASDYDVFTPRCLLPKSPPLTTWRENARYLASSPSALRFAFLCSYSHHSGMRQLGLQLLSQIRYPLDPSESCPRSVISSFDWTPLSDGGCHLSELTLSFITRCVMSSPDRSSLLGGLHFLAKLATLPDRANEASLLQGLPSTLWLRLAELLCLPDLAIVCACLDALRCLTNLGANACAFAWRACLQQASPPSTLLQPLKALLSLEGQAMGSQSLHRIRLMQRFVPPVQPSSCNPRSLPAHRTISSHKFSKSSTKWDRTSSLSSTASQMTGLAPSEAKMRHYNPEPLLQSIDSPSSRLSPPLSLQPLPLSAHKPTVYIPNPSKTTIANTSCAGLINLLSTSNGSSLSECLQTSHNSHSSVNVALTTPASDRISPSKAPVTVTPTLSEISDRLQMPPPSLPPPSSLRRTVKTSTKCLSSLSHKTVMSLMNESFQSDRHLMQDIDSTEHFNSPQILVHDGIVENCTGKDTITKSQQQPQPLNGVKPSILQAAVEALNEHTEESTVDQINANTLYTAKSAVELKRKFQAMSPKGSKWTSSAKREINLPNGKDLLNGYKDDREVNINNTREKVPNNTEHLHNGIDENDGDSGGSSSSSSENESPPKSKERNTALSRLFKRRRRWGCRSWPKSKRRREYSQHISKINVVNNNPDTSPLKPLPILSNPSSDSVLDPTWKCPWSSQEDLTIDHHSHIANQYTSDSISSTECADLSVDLPLFGHSSQLPTDKRMSYFCGWASCSVGFAEEHEIPAHVYQVHLSDSKEISRTTARRICQWRDCPSPVARAPFSLLTHVLDVHCSSEEMRARRTPKHQTRITNDGVIPKHRDTSTRLKCTQQFNTDPVDDQTAWSIVKTIESRHMQMEIWAAHHHYANITAQHRLHTPPQLISPPREGPVTKHLRVTAALIIRNFVSYLEEARAWFSSDLPLVTELLMGCSPSETGLRTNDSGSLIAQCLALCSNMSYPGDTKYSCHPLPHSDVQFPVRPYASSPKAVTLCSQNSKQIMYSSFVSSRSFNQDVDLDAN